jgi:hypothetical protein
MKAATTAVNPTTDVKQMVDVGQSKKCADDVDDVGLLAEEMLHAPNRLKLVQHAAGNGMMTVTITVCTKDDEDGWLFLGRCLTKFQELDRKTSTLWLADQTRPTEHVTKVVKPDCQCLVATYNMETEEIHAKVRAHLEALDALGAETSTVGWPQRFHDRGWYNWNTTNDYTGTHITFTCNPKISPTYQTLLKHKLVAPLS